MEKGFKVEGGGTVVIDRSRISHKEARAQATLKMRLQSAQVAGDADQVDALLASGDRFIEKMITGVSAQFFMPDAPQRKKLVGEELVSDLPAGWLDDVTSDGYEAIMDAINPRSAGSTEGN